MKKLMKMVAGVRLAFRSLCAGGCLALSASVTQAEPVEFRDYDAKTGTFTNAVRECTFVTDATRELAGGWYAVRGDVVIPAKTNLTVSGDAHLILCDGASLTIASPADFSAAVVVGKSVSLTIYGGANGTGRLEATGGSWSAGIGADNKHSCGMVTINGGTVTATGYQQSAGIGGSTGNPTGGTVTINGGTVTARGGSGAAGIGGGYNGAGGTVTINGGAIDALGGNNAAEIGSGEGSTQGKVWITGGIFAVRPNEKWLADSHIIVSNTDAATKDRYRNKVILNAVANAVIQITKTHINKYGEKTIEITGVQTNGCASISEAIAAAQAATMATVELVTNVNETVQVAGEGQLTFDLKGYTWAPSRGEDTVIFIDGSSSNLVLEVANGMLSGRMQIGRDCGEVVRANLDEGLMILGPDLVSDDDICVWSGKCVLMEGFKSTYEKPYSTRIPLIAMEGAEFACDQNALGGVGATVLTFQAPDLELIPTEDGAYKVGVAEIPLHDDPDTVWSYDLDRWMEDIPTNTLIRKITLPASHDSGMVGDKMERFSNLTRVLSSKTLYQTQKLSVKDQLKSGTRVFDFRFRNDHSVFSKDQFRTYHAMFSDGLVLGMMGETLDSILDAINSFLKDHGSEFVVVELTHWAKVPGCDQKKTQEAVLDAILKHDISNRMYKANPRVVKKDTPATWPILNNLTLDQVKGKVIVTVEPEDGTTPLDPVKGIWGVKYSKRDGRDNPMNGYWVVHDDYANKDDEAAMRADQLKRWEENTARGEGALPFCLNWTLTMQKPEAATIVETIFLSLSFAMVLLVFGMFITALCGGPIAKVAAIAGLAYILGGAFIGWWIKGDTLGNVEAFASQINPHLKSMLDEGVTVRKYNVPWAVSYDFVSAKYNRQIIDLNTRLVPYAAEVVNGSTREIKKYERLNDAFTNTWLKAASNRCTVRLLRQEEPNKEDGYRYVVPTNTFFTFDLNGKALRCPAENKGQPILVNNGTVKIVSTQSGGCFDGRGQSGGNLQGIAICNMVDLTVKDVAFNGFNGYASGGSVVYNNGKSLILEDVVITNSGSACVGQVFGRTILKDCNLAASGSGIPCVGTGGTIEMYDGRLSASNAVAVSVGGSCQFRMMSGVISHGKVSTARVFWRKKDVNVIIYDGFIKCGKEKCLDGDYRTIKVYGGCYGCRVDDGYIVNGRCAEVGTYPDYPFEIIPGGQKEGDKVARVVETQIDYPSVQDAIDAVARAGELQTIELLCPTHPVETLEFPKEIDAVLDLKGYRITKRGPEKPIIRNEGRLTLADSSEFGWGVVTSFGRTNGCVLAEAGGIIMNEGTFTLKGGTLCDAAALCGGGIYNATNGMCFIDGGTIRDCQAFEDGGGVYNDGVLVQRGGMITECSAVRRGGGVWNGGSATLLDGNILTCSAETGGGIVNENEYALFGGMISNTVSTVGASAILVDGKSLTTICGASVRETVGKVALWSPTAKVRVYEGLFGSYPERTWIQPGSKCVENEDAATKHDFPFRVLSDAVAQIGTMTYPTLQAAFDSTGGTSEIPVKLLKPVTREDAVLRDGCKAALDLAGLWVLSTKDALTVSTNAQLRIVDSVGGGKVGFLFPTNLAETCAVRNYGTCRIEGGRYNEILVNRDGAAMSIRSGLFSYHPDKSWIAPGSSLRANDDATTCLEYPFVVEDRNVARIKDTGELMTLARALRSEMLVGGGALRTVQLAEDAAEISVTVPTGRRAVLDLCGHWLRGKAHEPVITVEKGASLVIVDSVGGGLITKDTVHPQDTELQGAVVNYGELELAGGAISNCFSYAEAGGVYNAKGAKFVMSGGRIVGCGMLDTQRDRAAGVSNRGEFWMAGGEIVRCEAANGVMGVFNDEGAVFRQLGGRIEDCQNGAVLGAYVRNVGSYVLVDGRVADSNAGESNRVYCIDNSLQAKRFVQAYGEVLAKGVGYPIGSSSGMNESAVRIGNGKIEGVFHGAKGTVSGGFFTTDKIIADDSGMILPSDICTLATNDDVVTSGDYPYCVKKTYEVEVTSHNYGKQGYNPPAQFKCSTLAEALSDAVIQKIQKSYGFFPTNLTVKLLTDVKDCVECTVISNDYPEIAVTIDLNGFSLTGTGANRVLSGRCDPVIENHGRLRIVDSSADKTGFIAMSGICEPAWDGGGIRNAGYLELEGVTVFGCRADRGGGVFNAENGKLKMKNVRLLGCLSGDDAGGDCIFNAGDCELEDCELDLWPDARNPGNVRRGNAIVNSGSLRIPRGCRVRGGITNECAGVSGTISLSSGLFEQKPDDAWLEGAPDPKVICLANHDATTRIDYPWTIALGEIRSVEVIATEGVEISEIRTVLRSGGEIVYSEEADLEDDEDESGRRSVRVPTGCSIVIVAVYWDETGYPHLSTREFSGNASGIYLYKENLFEAETFEDNRHGLYSTLDDALRSGKSTLALISNASGSYHIPQGRKIVLDLNGFTVGGTGTAPVFVNEGSLTIRDSSSRGTGRLTNDSEIKDLIDCGGGVLNYGVFTLESGAIEDCIAGDFGGGIMGMEGSETYIRGGWIRNCRAEAGSAVYSRGRFKMTGGFVRDSMEFAELPPGAVGSNADATICGGCLGRLPDETLHLTPTAMLQDNNDDATRAEYPYQVVDIAACEAIYDVERVTQTYFDTHSTILETNKIYRFVEDVTLTGSTRDPDLASALAVTNGTTVLYIDEGVTVTLTGSVVTNRSPARSGAGLRVSQSGRVVIAGAGTLIAKGGGSTAGEYGATGGNPLSTGRSAGSGGNGGCGGSGASAAIGGCGGFGGAGGAGGKGERGAQPLQAGVDGEDGSDGEDMGIVVVLGTVKIVATSDLETKSGGLGASWNSGIFDGLGGGGGGGGGGSGGLPGCAIGGGGGGGAGAGGGGAGGFKAGASSPLEVVGVNGGSGHGGDYLGQDGLEVAGLDLDEMYYSSCGGLGGASGAAGSCGESEGFYAAEEVEVDCGGLYGSNFVARSISQHGALRRQIIILDEDDVEICRVEACLGEPLPEIAWALLGPKEDIRGLFLVNGGDSADALWYDGYLSPKKPRYETDDLGDVMLQVRYGKVVAILGKDTENERKFETLAAAVDEADYGDTISIVGDVRGENVKVPIGLTIEVESETNNFREPKEVDLRHKYYLVTTRGEGGKTYYTYGLNEEMVVPRIGSSDGTPAMEFVRDDEGKVMGVKLNVENVYEDLYYLVYWGLSPLPEEMVPVTWECADEDGTIRVEAPADDESGFYQIRVTDHLEWLDW